MADVVKIVNATELDAGLTSIAGKIREKTGSSGLLSFPDGMKSAINGLVKPSGDLSVTANGTYDISTKSRVIVNVPVPSGYVNYAEGAAVSDSKGYVTLPVLSFTPRVILLYRVNKYDTGEFLDDYTAYAGVILTYIYLSEHDTWFATVLKESSGAMHIANESATAIDKGIVTKSGNAYKLLLHRELSNESEGDPDLDITNVTLNYIAYG